MQTRFGDAVKFQQLYDNGKPASIETICQHLNETYNSVQHESNQRDKSYSGIRARVITATTNLICQTYQDYLLQTEVLNSKFFILVRDVIMRSFNETRHESVSDEEKKLLKPVCNIVLKIANSMTPELANCDMILLFFGKTFVLSMTECLKAFAIDKVSYGAEQKALIIKAILSMFSRYCVAKGDEAVTNEHVIGLVNAALCCVASTVYLRVFNQHLQSMPHLDVLKPKSELFLEICPEYVISYKKARREPMLIETKHAVIKNASNILNQVVPRIHEISPYLVKCAAQLVELLLLIPPNSFTLEPNLVKVLLNIIKISKDDSNISNEVTTLIQRSISLIYTLITYAQFRAIFIKSLSDNDMLDIFEKLASTSSDKHVCFMSTLIGWTLDQQNVANRQVSSKMIETFVDYLNQCGKDLSQQYNGVPLDSMITTLTGLVENENNQQELIKQDAVPTIVKYATDADFDAATIQQPSLECLWSMVFTPEVFAKLNQSPQFLGHLKMLLANTTKTTTEERIEKPSEELARVADGLLWKLEEEPKLLSKQKPKKEFEYDIMLSYQREDEHLCKKLVNRLRKQHKFRVWFDLNDMYGPIMTRMAEGIEKSEFILIAMSEPYAGSRYCRSEATHAYRCNRNIIPLKLHNNFRAMGWLALVVGDCLYVDFTKKQSFDIAYQSLIEQIELYKQKEQSGAYLEPLYLHDTEKLAITVNPLEETKSLELEKSTELSLTEEVFQPEKTPEPVLKKEPESVPTIVLPRRSLFRRFIMYVNRQFSNKNSNNNNASDLNNCIQSVTSTQTISVRDISQQDISTKTNIFDNKQMKDWTHNDITYFIREHKLEQFTNLLGNTDGTDLFHIYQMSQDNNKLFEYIKECCPDVKLPDYFIFIKILKNYAEQKHTNK